MRITTDFIHKHRTPRGGFSRAQMYALGVEWPPRRGWIIEAARREHTEEAVAAFVRFADEEIPHAELPDTSAAQPSLF